MHLIIQFCMWISPSTALRDCDAIMVVPCQMHTEKKLWLSSRLSSGKNVGVLRLVESNTLCISNLQKLERMLWWSFSLWFHSGRVSSKPMDSRWCMLASLPSQVTHNQIKWTVQVHIQLMIAVFSQLYKKSLIAIHIKYTPHNIGYRQPYVRLTTSYSIAWNNTKQLRCIKCW